MADKTYHAAVGLIQDSSEEGSSNNAYENDWLEDDQEDQDDWLHLPPFNRLEKICNDKDVFRRQLVGGTVPEALLSVSESSFDVARVLLIVNKISDDSEVSVRMDLVEHIPHICMTCQHHENTKLQSLVLSHFLPLNLKFLADRDIKVRKAAQKSLTMLLENEILDSNVVENVVCQHIISFTDLDDEAFHMSAIELMSNLAPFIGSELTEHVFIPKFVALCSSEFLNVRYTCAANFGDFCAVASQPVIEQSLQPNFIKLTNDKLWNVRKACANVIMSVSCACSLETRKSVLAPIFARLLNDNSRWVRFAAFQTLGPFITTFAQPSITGLAYNSNGELVLVNREGCEFKCPCVPPVSQTVNNKMYLVEDLMNIMSGGSPEKSLKTNLENRLQNSNSNNINNSVGTSNKNRGDDNGNVNEDSGVDNNYNYFQYWRDPIPSVNDLEDTSNKSSNLLKLSNSFDNLCSLVDSDTTTSSTSVSKDQPTKAITTGTGGGSNSSDQLNDEDKANHNVGGDDNGETCARLNTSFGSMETEIGIEEDLDSGHNSPIHSPYLRWQKPFHSQSIVPQELIDYYVTMFHCGIDAAENSDLAHHCAFSLPAVALTLGSSNWCLLRTVCKQLASGEHWKVRRMVASSIHDLACIVGPDAATDDLLPIYSELIQDLDEVRIGALRILSSFLYLLKPEGRTKFLPMFNKFLFNDYVPVGHECNWRFRSEFAEQLSQCLVYYSAHEVWDYLATLALTLMSDKVSAVRKVAMDLVYETLSHLSRDASLLRAMLSDLAEKFAHSTQWQRRQTFAILCSQLVHNSNLSHETFACDILPHLLDLSMDKVPNVRLCVARTLSEHVVPLPYFKSPCPHLDVLMKVLRRLRADPDTDVEYYATFKIEGAKTRTRTTSDRKRRSESNYATPDQSTTTTAAEEATYDDEDEEDSEDHSSKKTDEIDSSNCTTSNEPPSNESRDIDNDEVEEDGEDSSTVPISNNDNVQCIKVSQRSYANVVGEKS